MGVRLADGAFEQWGGGWNGHPAEPVAQVGNPGEDSGIACLICGIPLIGPYMQKTTRTGYTSYQFTCMCSKCGSKYL